MSLADLVRSAAALRMENEDGEVETFRLMPGLTAQQLDQLQATLPCPIPDDVRELLLLSRGFENGPGESTGFAGWLGEGSPCEEEGFGMEEIFPHPLSIHHDGCGNYWVIDLLPESKTWGPVFYACHDPPVIVYQCATLEEFIKELLRSATPPHTSAIDEVHDRASMHVWRKNPGSVPAAELRTSTDPALREFASGLSDKAHVVDLRSAAPGDGFSWGRFGPKTKLLRHGTQRIFACEPKPKWEWLLGR
jgi:hypothetical protein